MPGIKKRRWLYWLGFALIGVLAGSGLFFMVENGKSDTFLPGAYIADLPVGGLNAGEAEQALRGWVKNSEMQLLVRGPEGYEKRFAIEGVGGQVDYQGSITRALAEEKKIGPLARLRINLGQPAPRRYHLYLVYKPEGVTRWLEQVRFDVDRKPTEPRVVWEGDAMRVEASTSGRKLDSAAARRSLPRYYTSGEYPIKLVVTEVQPQVAASELNGLVELASYHTDFNAGNVNRTSNLKKAAAALNGTVVAPNQVFSFNDTVGPRELANGYLEAMVIIKNEFTPGVGGGICQVSSTLYNACLLAGLPVVERSNHSVAVAYVPVGLDATVSYPYRDFKFKNNADSAIYINAYVRGSRLWVKLFGRRDKPIKVKIERYVDKTIPFTTVEKIDNTLPAGTRKVDHEGVPGYLVRTYRVIYDASGQVRERKLLGRDTYAPLNKLVLVGPGSQEPTAPAKEEKPAPPVVTPSPSPEPAPTVTPPGEDQTPNNSDTPLDLQETTSP